MPELISEDQTKSQINQYIDGHNENIHKHKQIQNLLDIKLIKIENKFRIQIKIKNNRKQKKLNKL